MDHDVPEPDSSIDFVLSNPEALLAGTLALMTALVEGCCEQHRSSIRRKVIANLAELEQHEALSQQFRAVASHLQQHWFALENGGAPRAPGDRRLWQKPPEAIQ